MYTNYSLWLFVLCFCRFFVAILKDKFNSANLQCVCVHSNYCSLTTSLFFSPNSFIREEKETEISEEWSNSCDFISTLHTIKTTDHLCAMDLIVICDLWKAFWNAQNKGIKLDFKITNLITGFSEHSNEEESQFPFFLPSDVF